MRGVKKTARRTRQRRIIQTGGETVKLINIMLTQPIIDAVKERKPEFDAKAAGFKMSKAAHGFKLARMDNMMQANISELVQAEPVELRPAANHPTLGVLYDIVNGRHRVTRSIIDGLPTINATILQ